MRSYQKDKNRYLQYDDDINNSNTNNENDACIINTTTAHKQIAKESTEAEERKLKHSDIIIETSKKKEKTIVRQINLLTKKIERSTLSDLNKERLLLDRRNEFIEELNEGIKTDYSLKTNSEPINRSKYNIVQRNDDYIKISMIASNVELKTVATQFYIGEKGLSCSLKTYGREYISFGRQQIDDQFKRPNDIMLFPTDPSISRSHMKVFYKKLFGDIKEYKEKEKILLEINMPIEFIVNILEYLKPKLSVELEDNETIYGTYIRVKPLTYHNFLINLYLVLDTLKSVKKNERIGISLKDYIITYLHSLSSIIPAINSMIHIIVSYLKSGMIEELKQELIHFISKYFPQHFLDSFSSEIRPHYALLRNNNTVLKEEYVYLTSPKNGLIVRFIGSFLEVIKKFNSKYNLMTNNSSSIIIILSFSQLFNEQRYDYESSLYTLTLGAKEIIFWINVTPTDTFLDHLYEYDSLLCIETNGDPCGIMNRQTSILFIQHKHNYHLHPTDKSCSFNLTKAFLLGRHMKKSHMINIESNILIYYSHIKNGTWMIADLTPFLYPQISALPDYFGLWKCSSLDKGYMNRFKRTRHEIGNKDQVRLSESVLKFEFNIEY